VTLTLIVMCVLAFTASLAGNARMREETEREAVEALRYYQDHPYLELKPPLDSLIPKKTPAATKDGAFFAPSGHRYTADSTPSPNTHVYRNAPSPPRPAPYVEPVRPSRPVERPSYPSTSDSNRRDVDRATPRADQPQPTALDPATPEYRPPSTWSPQPGAAPPRGQSAPTAKQPRVKPDASVVAQEQVELDARVDRVKAALADGPNHRFGFVPSEPSITGLVTYQFMHGDFLHILGNMWFLWIFGFALEDKWGRAIFPVFYVLAGIAGALMHFALTRDSSAPLIGASGSVSGAMAAFLVVLPKARFNRFFSPLFYVVNLIAALAKLDGRQFSLTLFVPFYGWYLRLERGVPALVVLPLWLSVDFVRVLMHEGGNVAYGCHVGGTIFGLAFAGVLRVFGFQKQLDAAVESTVSMEEDPRLAQAVAALDSGDVAGAQSQLATLSRKMPLSIEVHLEMLRCAKIATATADEANAYGKLVELYLRSNHTDTAMDIYEEAEREKKTSGLTSSARIRMAEAFVAKRNDISRATSIYASIYSGKEDFDAVRATIAHARLAVQVGDRDSARKLYTKAGSSSAITPEFRRTVQAELTQLGG